MNCYGCSKHPSGLSQTQHMQPWGICLEDQETKVYRALPTALQLAGFSISITDPIYGDILKTVLAVY